MTGPSAQPVVHSPTPLIRRWTIASDLTLIEPVVETIVALCEAAGFSARHCKLNVPVAVTEAMANAMLRGNRSERSRTVEVRVELDTQSLRVDVTDEGVGFDLSTLQQSPDEADWFEREDGRGVFLMRTLMDRVESSGPDAETGHCIRLILHRT
ncbi:ATP-binding protein [Gemmatimonas sp.]|uniref:ATP-binding protein n=1 Tax=Gemmatimonas sp. TaxID=1962908 RepID=UPI00286E1EB9|nr:ATP-binding protein [Gemmatimonas sp.]